ncbi:hypothetical protein D9613_004779 [Agrocybe pediades]|uniref:Fungal-type protein kinase domain-containing protein n=1 Tax=Agrocybe pediades TaxID=84607 RepID=A0A8H4QXM5_9AGAR|nr:hypothetical protein D9613_004779 [Agrocybe pediades]
MSEAMKGRWIGPMPAQQFMDSFFDSTNPTCEKPGGIAKKWKTHFKSLGTYADASEMCSHIRELITESEAIPGFKISQVGTESDAGGYSLGKTTLTLFSEEDIPHTTTPSSPVEFMQLCVTTKLSKQKLKQDRCPEANDHKECCDISFGLEDRRKGCALCRDELVTHAKTLLNYQYRTHVFIIHMADPHASFIRFDRDGAIVSARFNYRGHGDLLLEFLWRFSSATSEARRRDPTVTRATAAEAALAQEKLARWVRKDGQLVYKLVIQDQALGGTTERKKMEVLVCDSVSRPSSVTGRATKGYIGYDRESDKVVFVKESWRSSEPAVQKETDTLRAISSDDGSQPLPRNTRRKNGTHKANLREANDWDQARTVEAIESGPHRDLPTGTWRFMSSSLLAAPAKFHMLQDDIESFFWVTVFISLCFLPNSWTSKVKVVMEAVFDEARWDFDPTVPVGGTGKFGYVKSFYPLGMPFRVQGNQPLTEFIARYRGLVKSLYSLEGDIRNDVLFETTERDMEREVYSALKRRVESIPLCTHAVLEDLFVEILAADGWPISDSAHDYFQEALQKSAEKRKAEAMQDYLDEFGEFPGNRKKRLARQRCKGLAAREAQKGEKNNRLAIILRAGRHCSARITATLKEPSTK